MSSGFARYLYVYVFIFKYLNIGLNVVHDSKYYKMKECYHEEDCLTLVHQQTGWVESSTMNSTVSPKASKIQVSKIRLNSAPSVYVTDKCRSISIWLPDYPNKDYVI